MHQIKSKYTLGKRETLNFNPTTGIHREAPFQINGYLLVIKMKKGIWAREFGRGFP